MKVLRRKKVLPIREPNWDISEDEYDKVLKLIFDGVRNLLICASVFALAFYAGETLKSPSGGYLEFWLNSFGGILLAALLGQWNRKTSRKKFKNTKLFLIVSAIHISVLPIILILIILLIKKQS